jgi:ubiquinone/menaquinone biosynthesis C-methylase UbiE
MKEWLKARSEKDVAEFYDRKYKAAGREAFMGGAHDYFFKQYGDLFGKPRPTDRLLDCGCGHAEFFEIVMSKYHFSSPHMTGIDVSKEALDLARNRLKNYEFGFSLFQYSMDEINPRYGFEPFDIVTSWGSIEHSFSPKHALENMLSVTKPGGIVMITVPLEFEGCLTHIENEEFI